MVISQHKRRKVSSSEGADSGTASSSSSESSEDAPEERSDTSTSSSASESSGASSEHASSDHDDSDTADSGDDHASGQEESKQAQAKRQELLRTMTNKAVLQEREHTNQPYPEGKPFEPKPMLELTAGSNIWYQAYVVKESANEVKLKVPGVNGNRKPLVQWLAKGSSRIWRGSLRSEHWKHLGKGAWEPKVSGTKRARGSSRGTGPSSGPKRHTSHRQQRSGTSGGCSTDPQSKQEGSQHQHDHEAASPRAEPGAQDASVQLRGHLGKHAFTHAPASTGDRTGSVGPGHAPTQHGSKASHGAGHVPAAGGGAPHRLQHRGGPPAEHAPEGSDAEHASTHSPHVAESPAVFADQSSARALSSRDEVDAGGHPLPHHVLGPAPHLHPHGSRAGLPHALHLPHPSHLGYAGHAAPHAHHPSTGAAHGPVDPLARWFAGHMSSLAATGLLGALPDGSLEAGTLPPGFLFDSASRQVLAVYVAPHTLPPHSGGSAAVAPVGTSGSRPQPQQTPSPQHAETGPPGRDKASHGPAGSGAVAAAHGHAVDKAGGSQRGTPASEPAPAHRKKVPKADGKHAGDKKPASDKKHPGEGGKAGGERKPGSDGGKGAGDGPGKAQEAVKRLDGAGGKGGDKHAAAKPGPALRAGPVSAPTGTAPKQVAAKASPRPTPPVSVATPLSAGAGVGGGVGKHGAGAAVPGAAREQPAPTRPATDGPFTAQLKAAQQSRVVGQGAQADAGGGKGPAQSKSHPPPGSAGVTPAAGDKPPEKGARKAADKAREKGADGKPGANAHAVVEAADVRGQPTGGVPPVKQVQPAAGAQSAERGAKAGSSGGKSKPAAQHAQDGDDGGTAGGGLKDAAPLPQRPSRNPSMSSAAGSGHAGSGSKPKPGDDPTQATPAGPLPGSKGVKGAALSPCPSGPAAGEQPEGVRGSSGGGGHSDVRVPTTGGSHRPAQRGPSVTSLHSAEPAPSDSSKGGKGPEGVSPNLAGAGSPERGGGTGPSGPDPPARRQAGAGEGTTGTHTARDKGAGAPIQASQGIARRLSGPPAGEKGGSLAPQKAARRTVIMASSDSGEEDVGPALPAPARPSPTTHADLPAARSGDGASPPGKTGGSSAAEAGADPAEASCKRPDPGSGRGGGEGAEQQDPGAPHAAVQVV